MRKVLDLQEKNAKLRAANREVSKSKKAADSLKFNAITREGSWKQKYEALKGEHISIVEAKSGYTATNELQMIQALGKWSEKVRNWCKDNELGPDHVLDKEALRKLTQHIEEGYDTRLSPPGQALKVCRSKYGSRIVLQGLLMRELCTEILDDPLFFLKEKFPRDDVDGTYGVMNALSEKFRKGT